MPTGGAMTFAVASIPRITTARLLLRELQMLDFEAYAANQADPQAATFFGGVADRRAAWRSFAAQTGSWLLNGGGWWAIEERETGLVVGTVGAFRRETAEARVELGWSLYPAHWRRGIATEAAAAALRYALETQRSPQVIAHIAARNVASVAVSRRLGMTYDTDVELYGDLIGRYVFTR